MAGEIRDREDLVAQRGNQEHVDVRKDPHHLVRDLPAEPIGLDEIDRRRSEEHTSELQSHSDLVCRLLLEKKKKKHITTHNTHEKTQSITSTHHNQPPLEK